MRKLRHFSGLVIYTEIYLGEGWIRVHYELRKKLIMDAVSATIGTKKRFNHWLRTLMIFFLSENLCYTNDNLKKNSENFD